MIDYIELKGIEVPESAEEWNKIEKISLADLINLPADTVRKAKATLVESEEADYGHFVYDLRNPRIEVDHFLNDLYDLDGLKNQLDAAVGKEIVIGGYYPYFSRFSVHYLKIGDYEFLS